MTWPGWPSSLELPQRAQPDQEEVIAAVVRWLRQHRGWLLVVDNLDREAPELAERRLPPDLPGHVLMTSRHPVPGWRRSLEPLSLDAATSLLLGRAQRSDVAIAQTVADKLGRLPLALAKASAYLEQTGEQLAKYAEMLDENPTALLAQGRAANYPRSVVATLSLSFERIEASSAVSADLLRLCAFFGPRGDTSQSP